MPKVMYDAVSANDIPATGWDALAGYTTGRYPSYGPIKTRFPSAPVMSIAIASFRDAMCADIEAGDLTPEQAPAWLDRQYARGLTKPVLYFGGDIDYLRSLTGSRPFWWWMPNGYLWNTKIQRPYITPGNDATQWNNHGPNGENVDQTLMSDEMFAHLLTGFTAPLSTIGDDMPTLQELHNDIEREGTQETGWSVGDAIAKRVSEEVGHALDASGTAGAADLRYNGVGKVLEILGALPQEIAAQIKVPAPDPAAIAAAIPADIAQEVADEIAKRLQPTDKPAV